MRWDFTTQGKKTFRIRGKRSKKLFSITADPKVIRNRWSAIKKVEIRRKSSKFVKNAQILKEYNKRDNVYDARIDMFGRRH